MPFLALPDIAALTKTSRRLENIVRSYLKQGGNITIDNNILSKFPSKSNRDKETASVTLKRIDEGEIAGLMSCFDKIDRLTLREMLVLNDIQSFPRSLTELNLIKVQIEDPLFEEVLLNNIETLKTLHLDQIETNCSRTPDGLYNFHDLCPNLSSLVVKVPSSYTSMCSDENLKVVTRRYPKFIKKLPIDLEFLYFDGVCNPLQIEEFTNLKSVTLRDCPENSFAPSLKHLKMIEAFDYNDKSFFDDYDIEQLEIVYYNEPVADTPGPNQILQTLNDDCLLKIVSYLEIEDILEFAKVHPKIY